MLRKVVLRALAVSLFCVWVLPGVAAAAPGDLSDVLNLTKEQRAQLLSVHQRFQGKKQSLRDQVDAKRQEIVGMMSSERPDRGAIERSLQEIVTLEGRRQTLVVDEYFEVLSILQPQQRKLFRDRVIRQIMR